jgi:hypothetical protein
MASLLFAAPAEAQTPQPALAAPSTEEVLLVAGLGNAVAEDYLTYARQQDLPGHGPRPVFVELSGTSGDLQVRTAVGSDRVAAVVLFLGRHLTASDHAAFDAVVELAANGGAEFIAVVSTFLVHLGQRDAAAVEAAALSRLEGLSARVVVIRPGYVLGRHSRASALLRRFGPFFPLVPGWPRHCFVEGGELFAAIERERQGRRLPSGPDPSLPGRQFGASRRVFTLLGPNRSWREVLAMHRTRGVAAWMLTALSRLLALLFLGHLAVLVLGLLMRRRRIARRLHLATLRPGSLRELLALYNPYNVGHVKVVGYNNGVNHFGHRYPGRTVVSTVHCDRTVRAGANHIKADCGATIRKALDFLAASGQELYVVPNYSYVCLGTAFFVPIHGSASDFSTVADTITRVILYDPVRDRLVEAGRNQPAFGEYLYNLASEVLLLRLQVRVKPKSRYFVRREVLEQPCAAEILAALRDKEAANVEARKGSAGSRKVGLSRYYTGQVPAQSPALELPRDTLGRLWDRLEENAITSFLMHALTRHFAWHIELFFTAEEFTTFWESHHTLPLKKLQLRYIRRDGFPHSPFRDHDCVSVDTFMLRRQRKKVETYLKRTFPVVRFNPGKHSR